MTRALRRRHVLFWLVVGPVVVALLVAALVVKPGREAGVAAGAGVGVGP